MGAKVVQVLRAPDGRALFNFQEGFTVRSKSVSQDIADGKLKGLAVRLFSLMEVRSVDSGLRIRHVNRVPDTQRVMAAALGVSEQSLSRALRELIQMGYVFKAREPDGRLYLFLDARRVTSGGASSHAAVLRRQAEQRRSNVHQLRGADGVAP
jgi:DNA-binding transcriptional ArsR family regulator